MTVDRYEFKFRKSDWGERLYDSYEGRDISLEEAGERLNEFEKNQSVLGGDLVRKLWDENGKLLDDLTPDEKRYLVILIKMFASFVGKELVEIIDDDILKIERGLK